MAVVARFYVSGYERNSYDPDQTTVTLQAVSRGEHNKNWSKYTPSGTIKMTIKNSAASDQFVEHLGREFEVTFRQIGTEVEDTDPSVTSGAA